MRTVTPVKASIISDQIKARGAMDEKIEKSPRGCGKIGGIMKRQYVLLILLMACAPVGAPNEFSVNQWQSAIGRYEFQSIVPNTSTALDLWPTTGAFPTENSLSEITLHRTYGYDPDMERINFSAMADPKQYRFGVERAGKGQFRDIAFCFEDVTPGVPFCPFKITTAGAFVSHDGGTTWIQL